MIAGPNVRQSAESRRQIQAEKLRTRTVAVNFVSRLLTFEPQENR